MSLVGLYTGLSGIRAAQTGIDVTSHNVANANTLGYTRQRVELGASLGYDSPVGRIGTGVTVTSIDRLRDAFLDARFRSAVADNASAGVRSEFLASLESLSGEPDNGLSVRIGELWSAAEAWSNDPADPASRRQVLTELDAIAEGFRSTGAAWDQLGADSAARRDTTVDIANDTLAQIHDLNDRITASQPGRVGADLFDQRDRLVDQVAQMTGTVARDQADGSVSITLDGQELLGPDGPATFAADTAADGTPVIRLSDGAGTELSPDVSLALSGELGGLQRVIREDLPEWRGALDQLAVELAEAVNAVNTGGRVADGSVGGDLFTYDPTDPAGSLATATDDIAALAAAGPGAGAPAPHDGTNARLLADLRATPVSSDGSPATTIEARLADLTVGLAGAVRSSRAASTSAGGVATGAELARASEHGVSLDEEMVGLVRYQRALEASARVMTTVDQALETLVNRVGIVGR